MKLIRNSLFALLGLFVLGTASFASTVNQSLIYGLGQITTPIEDDKLAAAGVTGQAGATSILSEFVRFTLATDASNNAAILKPVAEANSITFVVNDAGHTIQIWCAVGEKMNGSLNSNLAVPAGQSAVFVRATQTTGGPDWRASVIQ